MAEKNNSSESDVLFKVIQPFLEQLGYNEKNLGEIEHEKSISIGRNKYVYPDIVVNVDYVPAIVIDAKKPSENIDLYERQIISYGLLLKTPYSVITNGIVLRVYDTSTEKIIWEKPIDKIPKFLSKDNLLKKINKAAEIVTDKQIEEAKKTLLVFEGIKEFSTILYKCEDIIRDIDGLTGADAFDEISKILFTKMYYEKQAIKTNKNEMSSKNIKEHGGAKYVRNYLFKDVVKNNEDIFIGDEKIELEDKTIGKIVELIENYTLIKTDIDVKGRAFEIFLGKTFTGGLGQFFTSRTIVKFAVDFADPELFSTLGNKEEPYLTIDPACGSGGFLIEVFKNVSDKIKKLPENKQLELINTLSKKQLYGIDINSRLVRVAKMNMVLHGDGHGGIFKENGLEKFKFIKNGGIGLFDLVITNPPFGNKDKGEKFKDYFLSKRKGNILNEQLREVLYVEKCVNLTKEGGEIAILLPDGILNNEILDYVRDYIRDKTIIKAVVSLPDKAFKASGANSKTSLLFLKKKQSNKEEQPPIFMAVAEEVGYERKTKEAKEIEENDLLEILTAYKNYKSSKSFENLKNDKNIIKVIQEKPACFLVGEEKLSGRIDATYYYAKHIFELDVASCKVSDIAKSSKLIINPKKEPTKIIKYIQFSNIEEELGSVIGYEELLGEEAPSRAKQLVSKGDVISAKVKDSEQNIAIISEEFDGCVVSTGFVVLKPILPMTSEVLYVLLRLQTTLNQVRWKSTGTIMPAIAENEYLTIKIPRLSEKKIEELTKEIKEVEAQRKFIRDKLKGLSQKI